MIRRSFHLAAFLGAISIAVFGCLDNTSGPPLTSGPDLGPPYHPDIPTQWASSVTNEFFPLVPGTVHELRAVTDEGMEDNRIEVLSTIKVIQGVSATSVLDQVFVGGNLTEETTDWFAQDREGNVWYLGEDTKEYLPGGAISTEGSWEWGMDGALPGIIMWADPAEHVHDKYRQEFSKGVAEDWGKVVALDQDVSVTYGDFSGCVETLDWSGLQGGGRERKFYAPGVGVILEVPKNADEGNQLVNVTP